MKQKIELYNFTPISIQWNYINWVQVQILFIDTTLFNIEAGLFGINVSSDFMYVDLLFMRIKIFDKTN